MVWAAASDCSLMGFFDESSDGGGRLCDPGETRSLGGACGLCAAGTAEQRCSPEGVWEIVSCDDRLDADGDGHANALCDALPGGCCVGLRDCDDRDPVVHPEAGECATTTVGCATACGSRGTGTCTPECFPPAAGDCTPPPESCNGLDDDCDDAADDGFACVRNDTMSCSTTCGSIGSGRCSDACTPPRIDDCVPPAESCNGADDDCDGDTDEDLPCIQGALVDCTASCGTLGRGACTDSCAVPGPASCTPPAEVCHNAVDDDCDGETDEIDARQCEPGTTVACDTVCGSAGTGTCTDGCVPPTGSGCTPPVEVCNGVDDDCEGGSDEDWSRPAGSTELCTTASGSTCTGVCSARCGVPAPANCTPPVETCYGRGDDCGVTADNGYVCVQGALVACSTACGTSGYGPCSATCGLPGLGECTAIEACNGRDDDCDAATDEDFACVQGASTPCTTACGTAGSSTCSATCTPGACIASEECNGCDDNGNALCDETFACCRGATQPCTVCGGTGLQTCAASCGGWDACTRAEECNGCDDDGDTLADDGFACVFGSAPAACTSTCDTAGTRACSWSCTLDPCVAPETCNGCDDDGDTACDDGAGICCQGATLSCTVAGCGTAGTQTCLATCAAWSQCSAAETCNACDDDLDTVPDDGFICVRGATRSCTIATCPGTQTCLEPACDWGACNLCGAAPTVPVPLSPENGARAGRPRRPRVRRPLFAWQPAAAP